MVEIDLHWWLLASVQVDLIDLSEQLTTHSLVEVDLY